MNKLILSVSLSVILGCSGNEESKESTPKLFGEVTKYFRHIIINLTLFIYIEMLLTLQIFLLT